MTFKPWFVLIDVNPYRDDQSLHFKVFINTAFISVIIIINIDNDIKIPSDHLKNNNTNRCKQVCLCESFCHNFTFLRFPYLKLRWLDLQKTSSHTARALYLQGIFSGQLGNAVVLIPTWNLPCQVFQNVWLYLLIKFDYKEGIRNTLESGISFGVFSFGILDCNPPK